MRLSIIICVYNTDTALLRECLSSLTDSTLNSDYEIIFVDDGSSVSYEAFLKDYRVSYYKIERRHRINELS